MSRIKRERQNYLAWEAVKARKKKKNIKKLLNTINQKNQPLKANKATTWVLIKKPKEGEVSMPEKGNTNYYKRHDVF